MIGRVWTGVVARAELAEYVTYVEDTGAAEYRQADGCLLASVMTRPLDPERAEVAAVSVWETEVDLQRFTGEDIDVMRLYPEDEAFLLEPPSLVHHDLTSLWVRPEHGASGGNEAVARAFSGHSFDQTFDRLADDVRWTLVGAAVIHGRDDVIAACRNTVAELADTTTSWLRFVSTPGQKVVAVDTVGRYDSPGGVSAVASCDLFEFTGDMITAITSYTQEVDPNDYVPTPSSEKFG